MQPTFDEYWEERLPIWEGAARRLGVEVQDPYTWECSVGGLDAYMAASGVKFFSGHEATRPNQQWTRPLLAGQNAWLSYAVLGTVGDLFRIEAGRPVRGRNWFRPEDYNRDAARGAPRSDHLWACAVDFDFTGGFWRAVRARRAAQKMIVQLLPRNLLSLGVGWTTLHVGYAAPATLEAGMRHRRWKYGKMSKTEKYL